MGNAYKVDEGVPESVQSLPVLLLCYLQFIAILG